MSFEWDEEKNKSNIEKHGIHFKEAEHMFGEGFWQIKDTKKDYGESRYIGFGYVKKRLLSIVYTERYPNKIRIISLRKANAREVRNYEQNFKN